MENRFLIDISIKYGFDSAQISKLVDMVYQCGIEKIESREGQRVINFICEMGLIDKPAEEVIEELKLKGFVQQ